MCCYYLRNSSCINKKSGKIFKFIPALLLLTSAFRILNTLVRVTYLLNITSCTLWRFLGWRREVGFGIMKRKRFPASTGIFLMEKQQKVECKEQSRKEKRQDIKNITLYWTFFQDCKSMLIFKKNTSKLTTSFSSSLCMKPYSFKRPGWSLLQIVRGSWKTKNSSPMLSCVSGIN